MIKKIFLSSFMLAIFLILVSNPVFAKGGVNSGGDNSGGGHSGGGHSGGGHSGGGNSGGGHSGGSDSGGKSGSDESKELKDRGISEVSGGKGRPIITVPQATPPILTSPSVASENVKVSPTRMKEQLLNINKQFGIAKKEDTRSLNQQVSELRAQLGITQ